MRKERGDPPATLTTGDLGGELKPDTCSKNMRDFELTHRVWSRPVSANPYNEEMSSSANQPELPHRVEKTPPLLLVIWIDAVSHDGWRPISEGKELSAAVCTSCGFLIHENATAITLALSIGEDEFNAAMTIPKAWISFRREINLDSLLFPKNLTLDE